MLKLRSYWTLVLEEHVDILLLMEPVLVYIHITT